MLTRKKTFQLGLTRDFLTPEGKLVYQDIGLNTLDGNSFIEHRFLDRNEPVVHADQLNEFDAVISLTPRYTAESLKGVERLACIARFGVGYDTVDLDACTKSDIAVCITTGAVNHSMAESVVTWMLALSHRIMIKDHITRENRWSERSAFMGSELRDRRLGVIGLGGIGAHTIEILQGFGMKKPLAFDPYTSSEKASRLGATLVELDELLQNSDFVSINCPLTPQTRNLIGERELALIKPSAFLINTARGGIVNEEALVKVLQDGKIAGAALDVFETEPLHENHPLTRLDNVILAPHSIGWTHELFRDIGRMACRSVATIARGEVPEQGVVNTDVLKREGFQAKLERLRSLYGNFHA